MSVSTKAVKQDIDQLTREQLQQVADFITFLKFRAQRRRIVLNPAQLSILANEFSDEDRAFAELGIGDCVNMLHQEDQL